MNKFVLFFTDDNAMYYEPNEYILATFGYDWFGELLVFRKARGSRKIKDLCPGDRLLVERAISR
jgi:hypothetical protein